MNLLQSKRRLSDLATEQTNLNSTIGRQEGAIDSAMSGLIKALDGRYELDAKAPDKVDFDAIIIDLERERDDLGGTIDKDLDALEKQVGDAYGHVESI